jgi:hypothetical protein
MYSRGLVEGGRDEVVDIIRGAGADLIAIVELHV